MATETTTITTAPDGTTTIMTDKAPHGVPGQSAEVDGGSLVLGVVLTLAALGVGKLWKRLRGGRGKAVDVVPQPDAAASELAALRQRTAVLERIVTDPAARVAHEIDALR